MGEKQDKKKKQKKGDARRHTIVEAIRRNELASGKSDSMISRITIRKVATFDSEGVTLYWSIGLMSGSYPWSVEVQERIVMQRPKTKREFISLF